MRAHCLVRRGTTAYSTRHITDGKTWQWTAAGGRLDDGDGRRYHMSTATSQRQERPSDLWWGKALSAADARRLVAEYYQRTGTGIESSAATEAGVATMRHAMPSSVMHRLDIRRDGDARQRRRQQGLRVQVLAALADLRHLIAACAATGDKQGRVYEQLERLNQLYVDSMCGQAEALQLQSAGSVTLDTRWLDGDCATVQVVMWGTSQRRTVMVVNNDTSPAFERALYGRRGGSGVAADPRRASWVDCLVADMAE
ncbi:hypothetical protein H4R20_005051, partial [Coemansia guatemalensis]